MAFKMKAGSEGPFRKNFPGAFKKDPIRKVSYVTSKETPITSKKVEWTNPFTGKKRTKFKPLKGQGTSGRTEVLVGDITEAPGVGGSEKGKFKIKTRGKSGKTKEVFDPTTLEVTKKKKDGKRIK